jgi:hypothetical protein
MKLKLLASLLMPLIFPIGYCADLVEFLKDSHENIKY